ncbi:hypothetical protein P2B13_16390 [Xanthomonas perforans]
MSTMTWNRGYIIGLVAFVGLAGTLAVHQSLSSNSEGHSPQNLLSRLAPRSAVAVNRLSNIKDTAGLASEVTSIDPLTQLNNHPGRVAALSELGQFAEGDPTFTLTINAPNIDVALDSLKQIYAALPANDAEALDFAVRFLAVTRLKGTDFTAYGQDPTAIPDTALFQHILPTINGRTPMQVIVEARKEQERLAQAREAIPVDPFDRIEMERRGQPPGMSIPR